MDTKWSRAYSQYCNSSPNTSKHYIWRKAVNYDTKAKWFGISDTDTHTHTHTYTRASKHTQMHSSTCSLCLSLSHTHTLACAFARTHIVQSELRITAFIDKIKRKSNLWPINTTKIYYQCNYIRYTSLQTSFVSSSSTLHVTPNMQQNTVLQYYYDTHTHTHARTHAHTYESIKTKCTHTHTNNNNKLTYNWIHELNANVDVRKYVNTRIHSYSKKINIKQEKERKKKETTHTHTHKKKKKHTKHTHTHTTKQKTKNTDKRVLFNKPNARKTKDRSPSHDGIQLLCDYMTYTEAMIWQQTSVGEQSHVIRNLKKKKNHDHRRKKKKSRIG